MIKPKVVLYGFCHKVILMLFFAFFNQMKTYRMEGSTEQGVIKIKEQTEKLNELKSTVIDLINKFNDLLFEL